MKSAKEMFEELGFEYIELLPNICEGIACFKITSCEHISINFYKKTKFFLLHSCNSDGDLTMSNIDMDLLKAINKQCEELGWLEDGRL